MTHKTLHAHMHPYPIHGVHHLEKVGLTPQVLVVPVAVAVAVVGALPVALVQAILATAVPIEVVLVLLHGVPQMQMVQIQADGGYLVPVDGKVQVRKLILVGIGSSYFVL